MPGWITDNQTLLTWLAGASVVMFIGTLVLAPAMILRIPPDYFTHDRRPPGLWADRHPALRAPLAVARAAVAGVFILAGVAMLVLPGQGLLTLLIGFLLLEFPGKYRLEQRLIARPRILRLLNALRRRRGRPPLQTPDK